MLVILGVFCMSNKENYHYLHHYLPQDELKRENPYSNFILVNLEKTKKDRQLVKLLVHFTVLADYGNIKNVDD